MFFSHIFDFCGKDTTLFSKQNDEFSKIYTQQSFFQILIYLFSKFIKGTADDYFVSVVL